MNGRLYDPELGQFISPDPIVADPFLPQAWNRYAYVLNNPLSHIDPSGFTALTSSVGPDVSYPGNRWNVPTIMPDPGVLNITISVGSSGFFPGAFQGTRYRTVVGSATNPSGAAAGAEFSRSFFAMPAAGSEYSPAVPVRMWNTTATPVVICAPNSGGTLETLAANAEVVLVRGAIGLGSAVGSIFGGDYPEQLVEETSRNIRIGYGVDPNSAISQIVDGVTDFGVILGGAYAGAKAAGGRTQTSWGAPKKTLLPGEGAVGTYDDLISAGSKGDNITPHHIPSAYHMARHGVSEGNGIAINMEHPHPGGGGRHRQTFTYGTKADAKMSPRQALGAGVWDARRIFQQDGVWTPEMRRQLQELIMRNRAANPGLFDKK